MCGITGAIGAPVSDEVLGAALASLRHRGPDAEGRAHFAGASLGHRRLAVIDLSPAGEQPMFNDDRSVAVVFNGEIYNHHVLRRELEALGARFVSRSDTEVIVRGYEQWGDSVVARLDGMFAFALHDDRRKRTLLARDRAGKKPLFYAQLGERVLFGSEIKALLALGLHAALDTQSLPFLLVYGYVPSPRSLYREVRQLPPAHLMVVEAGRVETQRYWSVPFTQPALQIEMREAAGEVRRLVEQAVASRLEADVPLGAFLSGGVDSTIVVGVMSRLLGRKVKTFSIGFSGDARYDETHYARIAARAFATEHTEFTLQPSSFDLVEKLVALHDGPFGDSSAIPTSVVSMLTREHVTVALSGDGGDELFCGYPRFLAAEAAERIPAVLRHASQRLTDWLPGTHAERTLYARGVRFLKAADRDLPDRLATWTSVFSDLAALVRPELGLDLEAPWQWNREIFAASAHVEVMRRILHNNFSAYLPEDLLVKADRSSMAHALEVRSPFLDTALIEFASRLPPHLLRRGTKTKRVLRHAFADLIPPAIQRRGKMGFGMPLGAWFRGELRSYVHDRLTARARLFEYLQYEPVARLLREHDEGRADHGHRIWLLLTLEVWLRSLAA
jgi:asparagine synthase (glutamine-hydrolysing)